MSALYFKAPPRKLLPDPAICGRSFPCRLDSNGKVRAHSAPRRRDTDSEGWFLLSGCSGVDVESVRSRYLPELAGSPGDNGIGIPGSYC